MLHDAPMPDILECISSLSNDEVFTMPKVANQVLDLLPPEVWTDPTLRWLDPGCKTGVFLREAAKRLMAGLVEAFPDAAERREHIYRNMLYGVAITQLTADISRRTLYYTKDPASELAVVHFDGHEGNIWYENLEHVRKTPGANCELCGAAPRPQELVENRENYAYGFIHKDPKELFDMEFDVIVGNPPYQLQAAGGDQFAVPIYHKFIDAAIAMRPRYVCMIVPSRWFVGGLGLEDFRSRMLADRRIRAIYDYPNASECFPGVSIEGGVNYFRWDRESQGPCLFNTVRDGDITSSMERELDSGDGILIRSNEAISILGKIQATGEPTMDRAIPGQKPFGLATNFEGFAMAKSEEHPLRLYRRGEAGWVSTRDISNLKNIDSIDRWKVFTSKAYGGGRIPSQVTGMPFIGEPGSVCTNTYLLVGPYDTKRDAERVLTYMKTRFVRFLVSLRKATQDMYAGSFRFVPDIGVEHAWTDEALYVRYGLDADEVAYIESQVKEMP